MITNGTVDLEHRVVPVLDIEIVAGEDSEQEKLGFTWRVVAQTATTLTLEFVFDNAILISANGKKETIIITIKDPLLFFGSNGLPIKKKHLQIGREMPAQLSQSAKFVQKVLNKTMQGV